MCKEIVQNPMHAPTCETLGCRYMWWTCVSRGVSALQLRQVAPSEFVVVKESL